MSTAAVRIEAGYYLIDTQAWVRQRVGERHDQLTDLVDEFTRHDLFGEQPTPMDVSSRVVLWCAAHGWPVHETAPLYHDDQRMTHPVSIILATAPGPDQQAVAIVLVADRDPVVYADVTTDEGYWYTAATVDIACPSGHWLTWDGGGHLVTDDGTDTTLADLFGSSRYAPFRPCRDCQADETSDDTEAGVSCDCGGWALYCPVCDARCRLTLPEVPTHPQLLAGT